MKKFNCTSTLNKELKKKKGTAKVNVAKAVLRMFLVLIIWNIELTLNILDVFFIIYTPKDAGCTSFNHIVVLAFFFELLPVLSESRNKLN